MKLLYFVHELPWPAHAGHTRRWLEILQSMPNDVDVTVAGFTESPNKDIEDALRTAAPAVSKVAQWPLQIRLRRRPLALARAIATSVADRAPYSVAKFESRKSRSMANQLIREYKPDIIIAGIQTAHLALGNGIPLVIDTHNIEHDLWKQAALRAPLQFRPMIRREIRLLEAHERHVWRVADAIIAICDEDAHRIAATRGRNGVFTLPVNIPDLRRRRTTRPAWDVGMLGVWSWAPNEAALETFADTILPPLTSAGVKVRIAGPGVAAGLAKQLSRGGAEVSGFIPDVAEFYESIGVSAAPFFAGGGVRMKVAESISYGVPIIGTPLAFRGLKVGHSRRWIYDDPKQIADGLIELARNSVAARAVAIDDWNSVHKHHAPHIIQSRLLDLLRRFR